MLFRSAVYILDINKFKLESSHKKRSKQEYLKLLKHELSHLFFTVLVRKGYCPIWLWEGLPLYTSGQYLSSGKIKEFSEFLSFYDSFASKDGKKSVYTESGFFIKVLVEKFGKEKLLKFLKSLRKVKNKKEFNDLFFKTYKFKLNYREANKMA